MRISLYPEQRVPRECGGQLQTRVLFGLRRFSAILLLLLFGLSLLSPLFGSDGEANLPACCRRAGKHHCAMPAGSGAPDSGPALRGKGRCPSYPSGFGVGTVQTVIGVAPASASAFMPTAEFASCNSFELRVLSSLRFRAHGKRGPPLSA
jgi:hypothetical protein